MAIVFPRPRVWMALIAVAITACGLVYDVDSLEEGKCGGAGERCCAKGTCDEGAVCVEQNKLADAGGKPGDAATPDAGGCACDAGTDRDSGTEAGAWCECGARKCVRCGGPLEPCCTGKGSGSGCNDTGLACTAGVCKGCGEPHQACCKGAVKCARGLSGLTCENDVCKGCGGESEPCCGENPCGDGLACQNKTCVACGASGQPCCGTGCNAGLRCDGGRCSECGNQDQPCCNGGCNISGLYCKNGTSCQPCGTLNADCCPTGSRCGTGLRCWGESCQPCGTYGALCCDTDPVCDGYSLCDGTYCKQCCVCCKNYGTTGWTQYTYPISACVYNQYADICRAKNHCGTTTKDACCADGTCTVQACSGLCH